MSYASRKIELGENDRRVISVLRPETARACDEMIDWLDRSSSVLVEIRVDLEPEQRARLRELAATLKRNKVIFDESIRRMAVLLDKMLQIVRAE